jgi:hypothetical protein
VLDPELGDGREIYSEPGDHMLRSGFWWPLRPDLSAPRETGLETALEVDATVDARLRPMA